MDEEERTSAVGLLGFAHSYWEAAVALDNTQRKATHPDSPRDYLYYHAIELYLKAYLRLKGSSVKELWNLGHKLNRLYETAVRNGLNDIPYRRALMNAIDRNYKSARYISTGYYVRPRARALWSMCHSLHEEIEPQIHQAWKVTRKRHIPWVTARMENRTCRAPGDIRASK